MATGQAAERAAQQQGSKKQDGPKNLGTGSVSGNIGYDPELRYTGNGKAVTRLRVASATRKRDEGTGKWKETGTAWYEIEAWGNLAENICEHLLKGDRVVAEGFWAEATFTKDDGSKGVKVYLVAHDLGPSMMFKGARPVRRNDGE
jgi:single-strand DNA-binding protein